MSKKTIAILRNIARTILIIISAFWFVFALLSGASELGGGVMGVIKNSPNALPWLLLFVITWAIIKWELVGGIILTLFGIFTIFAFDTYEQLAAFLVITCPFIILGVLFIISGTSDKK